MSQQHEQFEEVFRDGPPSQPISSYQAGYPYQESVSSTRDEPSFQAYRYEPGQKLLDRAPRANRSARLFLGILSLLFVLVLYAIPFINVEASSELIIAIVFSMVVLLINVIFHYKQR
jgi:hypothetical protein